MANILFVNSSVPNCGVHQFGKRTYDIIKHSSKYAFPYITDLRQYQPTFDTYKPKAVIFNYHPSTIDWVNHDFLRTIPVPKLALYHEVPITGFDYYIHLDPTKFESSNNFVTGRPLFNYKNDFPLPEITTIGSFGFGFDNKGYTRIVDMVNNEYDTAIIRFHIPYAHFGDSDGRNARRLADSIRATNRKNSIRIDITHHFMDDNELLNWLAQNTVNCFFFDNMYGRGISSSTDYALSVQRPIAITNNWMHRHIRNAQPTITIDNAPLKWIVANGNTPLEPYQQLWSNENLIKDYERILDEILK